MVLFQPRFMLELVPINASTARGFSNVTPAFTWVGVQERASKSMQHVHSVMVEVAKNATSKEPFEECDFIFKIRVSGFLKLLDKTGALGAHLSHSLRPLANGCRG